MWRACIRVRRARGRVRPAPVRKKGMEWAVRLIPPQCRFMHAVVCYAFNDSRVHSVNRRIASAERGGANGNSKAGWRRDGRIMWAVKGETDSLPQRG